MTRRTVRLRDMFAVIEFRAEGREPRKCFHCSRSVIGVANGAHLAGLRVLEMLNVAAGTRRMVRFSWESDLRGRRAIVLMA